MKITCPECGFSGAWGATVPLEPGGHSRPVDLLDAPAYVEPAFGEVAICSGCSAALMYAGWVRMPDDLLAEMSPENQEFIRRAQDVAREFRRRQG